MSASAARIIRTMTRDDALALGHVIARVKRAEFGAEAPEDTLARREAAELLSIIVQPRARFYVAELNGEVVGGAGFLPLAGDDDHTCMFRTLFLLVEARGQGLGRALLEEC